MKCRAAIVERLFIECHVYGDMIAGRGTCPVAVVLVPGYVATVLGRLGEQLIVPERYGYHSTHRRVWHYRPYRRAGMAVKHAAKH